MLAFAGLELKTLNIGPGPGLDPRVGVGVDRGR